VTRRAVTLVALGALAAAAVAAARRRARTAGPARGGEPNGHRAGDGQESLRRFVEAGERRRESPGA
jgi:hypothetical protein